MPLYYILKSPTYLYLWDGSRIFLNTVGGEDAEVY